jgi:predicted TIM-barrel fold metal-dependent hydrolase
MGADRILFAVDWPFVANADGVDWLKAFPTDQATKRRSLRAMPNAALALVAAEETERLLQCVAMGLKT